MTKIAIAARYADDTPYGRAQVTIRLVDGTAGASLPGGLSVERTFVTCDSTGEAVVDLTPNEDVTPVGTYYALTVERTSPTVVRYIEVPQPNGTGDAEIPYAWDDETIQRLNPTPPTSIPAASSGDAGQVVTVVDDGNGKRYSLEDPAGASVTGATEGYVDAAVAAAIVAYISGAPSDLDTPNELAAAIADDPAFATTVTTALAGKQAADADLTAVAAKATTSYGLGLLELVNAAAGRTSLGLVIGTDVQAHSSTLDSVSSGGLLPNGEWKPPAVVCWQDWYNASTSPAATPTRAQNSGRYTGGYLDTANVSGHWIEFELGRLDSGTWSLRFFYDKLAANGEYTLSLGLAGGSLTALASLSGSTSTLNMYASSTSANAVVTITGIVIPTTGRQVLRATNTGTGGGSSYGGRWMTIKPIRTA